MTSRRRFLQGLAAASLSPLPGWSAVGAPDFLAAALFPDGSYRLAGLTASGTVVFTLPLPGRGHAAAAHPQYAQAVAFARRPGTFALVIDCTSGSEVARLSAPSGYHFYGHGTFSTDGRLLFTTENRFEQGDGMIGVWDVGNGYARLGSFSSGGIGPHDIVLMPDGASIAIANGGIETHPDTGRTKLNLPTMRPNLTYCDLNGSVMEQVELPHQLLKNSIRHLAVRNDGLVAFAMQWQGDLSEHPPLLGLHQRGGTPVLLAAGDSDQSTLQGYAGSVAFSSNNQTVAITCPRGNALHGFDVESGSFKAAYALEDVCGLGTGPDGLVYTTGTGRVGRLSETRTELMALSECQWDNHLVPVKTGI
ncbi:MAG: DUF1513 domain-containing protein [Ruegeria sp.]